MHDLEHYRDRYPPGPGSALDRVVRSNASLLIPIVTREQMRAAARDEEHLRLLERLQMRSVMIVPLATAKGDAFGAISLVASESGHSYMAEDLEVAEMVAQRAAAAIQTAKTLEEERRRAQRSRFLARASEKVFDSYDLQSSFDSLTEFIVTEMADLA